MDKKACASLAGNANDICVAQAKGKEGVALSYATEPEFRVGDKVKISAGVITRNG